MQWCRPLKSGELAAIGQVRLHDWCNTVILSDVFELGKTSVREDFLNFAVDPDL